MAKLTDALLKTLQELLNSGKAVEALQQFVEATNEWLGEHEEQVRNSDRTVRFPKELPSILSKLACESPADVMHETRAWLTASTGVLQTVAIQFINDPDIDDFSRSDALHFMYLLSKYEDMVSILCRDRVVFFVLEYLKRTSAEGLNWIPISFLWQIAQRPAGCVFIMLLGGVPPLIKLAGTSKHLQFMAVGTLAALCQTPLVRKLVQELLITEEEGVLRLIEYSKGEGEISILGSNEKFPASPALGFQAAMAIAFLLLESPPILLSAGAEAALGYFAMHSDVTASYGPYIVEPHCADAMQQLFAADSVSILRFLAFFYARYSIGDININTGHVDLIAKLKTSLPIRAQVLSLSMSSDPRTRELALTAIANLFPSELDTFQGDGWLGSLVTNKRIRQAMTGFDIGALVSSHLTMEDIRPLVMQTKLAPGHALSVLNQISVLRSRHKKLQVVGHNGAREASQRRELQNIKAPAEQGDGAPPKREELAPVFLSYSWADQRLVRMVKSKLEMAGCNVWMDEGVMKGGDELFGAIDDGISNARVVVACISADYAKSTNCCREVMLAASRSKLIVPAMVRETSPWPPRGQMAPVLAGKLYVPLFGNFESDVDRLVEAVLHSLV